MANGDITVLKIRYRLWIGTIVKLMTLHKGLQWKDETEKNGHLKGNGIDKHSPMGWGDWIVSKKRIIKKTTAKKLLG